MGDFGNGINLDLVMTLSEASEKWGFSNGATIRKAIEREKFKSYEIKRSGNVWLITYDAMNRVFGEPNKTSNDYILYLDDIINLYRKYIVDETIDYLQYIYDIKDICEKYIDSGNKIMLKRRVAKDTIITVFIIKTEDELERIISYFKFSFEKLSIIDWIKDKIK
ncbi:hypothetical protein SAMN02745163_01628 [Clostridium cavendishii DSM 21758]|uniref:Helix-turn-helix domain-containing protein n=2 Tax=Clostridium TaxID=1485 RepID=A0A1M6HYB3_9CLOT|nr:hypothetical protein SAMN02745163_01628 [Clostridium cavendishii DSM 21758]